MRRYTLPLILALVLALPSAAQAAPALVAHSACGNTTAGCTTTGIDTTGATLLVLGVVAYGVGPPLPLNHFSDSKGNTWTCAPVGAASPDRAEICYVANPTVGSGHTVTFTSNGGTDYPAVMFAAFAGVVTTSPLDQANGTNPTNGTTTQPGSITPTQDGALVVTVLNEQNATDTPTINGGYTIIDSVAGSGGTHVGGALAYLVQTTATATNPTWTIGSTSDLTASIASFLPSVVVGSFPAGLLNNPVIIR